MARHVFQCLHCKVEGVVKRWLAAAGRVYSFLQGSYVLSGIASKLCQLLSPFISCDNEAYLKMIKNVTKVNQ